MKSVGVRDLAAFVHRRGDIHFRYEDRTRPEEGLAAQRRYQEKLARPGTTYTTEHRVAELFEGASVSFTVTGRIDGCCLQSGLVEEIKTTRIDSEVLHAHIGSVHIAQARLYAAMLCKAQALPECLVRLTYLDTEGTPTRSFDEQLTAAELCAFWETTCAAYAAWLGRVAQRVVARDAAMRDMPFPYAVFHDEQRHLARNAYTALRDADHLLADAPTGTGKTIAMLFPAAKAMGQNALDRVVFASARTTGQNAARTALEDLQAASPGLSSVTITAKERICFNPGTPCDPTLCEFARGYFDRIDAARDDLLAAGISGRDTVERVAREHTVCPFELSLDAAAWSDVVVCDYNYVFDPVVNFKRLKSMHFPRVGLLVDEAHQLGDRVRDMLSTELDRTTLGAARRECGDSALGRRIASIDRALRAFAKTHLPRDGEALTDAAPDAVFRALERFSTALADAEVDFGAQTALRDAGFQAFRFLAGRSWHVGDDYRFLLRRDGRRVALAMRCLAPATHIRQILDSYHGAIRFSGTLAPAGVFQAIHGCEGRAMRAASSFSSAQLGIFVVSDVSTYFRSRDRTAPKVARLIRGVAAQGPGSYLVAFPSFEYLNLVCAHLDGCDVRVQTPNMTIEERDAFIRDLNCTASKKVGLVVMGGVFAESVDYDRAALSGVIVVGAGIPPPTIEREALAAATADGFDVAYRQPAMTRAVQAAGRVVRAVDDHGVVVLVDPRFAQPEYQAYFPSHWNRQNVRGADVGTEVAAFWRAVPGCAQDRQSIGSFT